MIVPIVQAMTRHSLNIETDESGLAIVEVSHTRHAVTEREHVSIVVSVDDPDVIVDVQVKPS